MAGALIRYVCRSTAHQHARRAVTSPVTLHENEWAFCPAGFIGEHTWEQIEGETLETLRHHSAEVRVKT